MKTTSAIDFHFLNPSHFNDLHHCFNEAFSDYKIKMELSAEDLQSRLKRMGFQYGFSIGAFEGDKMVGFILTGLREEPVGQLIAYNGGTGVIPTHRKQKIAERMYSFLLNNFRREGVTQCLLEVISDNEPAIQLYERLGFRKVQLLRCLALKELDLPKQKAEIPIQIAFVELPDWELYQAFYDDKICWQNSQEAILQTIDEERIIEAYHKTETVGYAIFNPQKGKISQLAVAPEYRNKKIGHQLLRAVKELSIPKKISILNIPEKSTKELSFLQKNGFEILLSQWEMRKKLAE